MAAIAASVFRWRALEDSHGCACFSRRERSAETRVAATDDDNIALDDLLIHVVYPTPRRNLKLDLSNFNVLGMDEFSEDWLTRYQQFINTDEEMRVIGDWFTTSFSLASGDRRCIVRFERGKLIEMIVRQSWTFGVRSDFVQAPKSGRVFSRKILSPSTTTFSPC